MYVNHGVGYLTKRTAQLVLIKEDGAEVLVTVDVIRAEGGTVTGFKPKTKGVAEVEYLAANKDAVVAMMAQA